MGWVEQYRDDIDALARVGEPLIDRMMRSDRDQFHAEFNAAFGPLLDGSLVPGDVESVRAAGWAWLGEDQIRFAKETSAIQRRLAPLYAQLATASPDEWRAYAQIVFESHFAPDGPFLRFLTYSFRSAQLETTSAD